MAIPSRATGHSPVQQAGPEGIQGSAIDLAHLDLHTFNDRTLRSELLGIFDRQLDEYVGLLEQADSHDAWMRAAHTLKGSARAIGAGELADLCAFLEGLGPDGWQAGRADAVCRLRSCVRACRAAIRAIIASQ